MKKIFLILSFVLALGATVQAAELKDISNYKFEKEILTLQALHIVEGDENNNFHPTETVKRSEAAKMLMTAFNAEGFQCPQKTTEFSDVASSHWASGYIQAATDIGYITGMGDGTFQPDAEITLEQACTLVVRALGYDILAENSGGYPNGYLRYAEQLDLKEKLSLANTDAITRGELAYLFAQAMEAPMIQSDGIQMQMMSGRGRGYVCPLSQYRKAYWVRGQITATPRSSSAVRDGWADLDISYARRLGIEYINQSKVIRCKTVDGSAINDLLFLTGDFLLKETGEDEYTVIMIVL